jgi:hypothetical protein
VGVLGQAGRPVKARAIAARKDYSPAFRETLARLVRDGTITQGPDGYTLPAGDQAAPDSSC